MKDYQYEGAVFEACDQLWTETLCAISKKIQADLLRSFICIHNIEWITAGDNEKGYQTYPYCAKCDFRLE